MKELDFGQMEQDLQKYMETMLKKGETYPAFFGGTSYKNGIITFYVLKETTKDIKNKIESIIPDVVFEEAKVAKQTLYHCYQQINKKYLTEEVKRKCEENMLSYFFVDDEHGNITIAVENLNKKKEEAFKNIFFDIKDYLVFEEANIPKREEASGSGYEIGDNKIASYGFPATHPLHGDGFVISTHGAGKIGDEINDSAKVVMGNINAIQNGGSVDAAFVTYCTDKTLSPGTACANKKLSPKTAYSHHHMQYTITFKYLKALVTMDGSQSRATVGIIKSHDASDKHITDCYLCKYPSTVGDSGGPITLGSYLLGIHIAGSHTERKAPKQGTKHRTLCCKYRNISQAFQIELNPQLYRED